MIKKQDVYFYTFKLVGLLIWYMFNSNNVGNNIISC